MRFTSSRVPRFGTTLCHDRTLPTTANLGEPLSAVGHQVREPEFDCFTNQAYSIVEARDAGAISRETILDLFRRGEVLPEGRTKQEEEKLIRMVPGPAVSGPGQPRM